MLFKTTLTFSQLAEKINSFDSRTAEIETDLNTVSEQLNESYEAEAQSSITGEGVPSKAKLKALRDKKNDLQGELAGRQKVRAKLEQELKLSRKREELGSLTDRKKQAASQIVELGRTADNLENTLRKVFDALDKIRGIERSLPRNGGEYFVRSSELIIKNIKATLDNPLNAEKLYSLLASLSEMLQGDLERWETAQSRRIEEKHTRIQKEAGA